MALASPLGSCSAAAWGPLLAHAWLSLAAPGEGANSIALSLPSCAPETVPTLLSLGKWKMLGKMLGGCFSLRPGGQENQCAGMEPLPCER